MKNHTIFFLLLLSVFYTLSGCVTHLEMNTRVDREKGLTWFYPVAGTDNYYSPRKGKSDLKLIKSGANYWYKNDEGKVVWFYPQGDRFYSPGKKGKQVWCNRSGANLYCTEK